MIIINRWREPDAASERALDLSSQSSLSSRRCSNLTSNRYLISEKHDTTHDIKVTFFFLFLFSSNQFESIKPEALSMIHQ